MKKISFRELELRHYGNGQGFNAILRDRTGYVRSNHVFTLPRAIEWFKEFGVRADNIKPDQLYYISERGFLHTGKQYRDFDQQEREQIIEDFLTHGSKYTRELWKIDSSTLHHIRWHNKEAEEEIEDAHFAKAGL